MIVDLSLICKAIITLDWLERIVGNFGITLAIGLQKISNDNFEGLRWIVRAKKLSFGFDFSSEFNIWVLAIRGVFVGGEISIFAKNTT